MPPPTSFNPHIVHLEPLHIEHYEQTPSSNGPLLDHDPLSNEYTEHQHNRWVEPDNPTRRWHTIRDLTSTRKHTHIPDSNKESVERFDRQVTFKQGIAGYTIVIDCGVMGYEKGLVVGEEGGWAELKYIKEWKSEVVIPFEVVAAGPGRGQGEKKMRGKKEMKSEDMHGKENKGKKRSRASSLFVQSDEEDAGEDGEAGPASRSNAT